VRPYLSVRFIGDLRETTGEAAPQYLSESAFLLAGGLVTRSWHGLLAWAEAGKAVGYRDRPDQARITADYRGGVAFSRGAGQPLSGEAPGLFAESSNDGVFVSRFANDVILYSQNRSGYTLPRLAGLRSQVFVGGNLVADLRRQYWANFVEFGPGVRFRWEGLPPSLVFSVSVMRGVYTRNEGNPRRPNFFDLRAGFWYAGTW
jgi:hypothetical protein